MAAALTVYEKPTCTTCRKLAALLREHGIDYDAVDYHVTGLTETEIRDLLAKARARPRDVLRAREPLVRELGLDDPGAHTDDELIALMAEHPELVQRPIVVRGDRAVLARPVERVLELLDRTGAGGRA
jgi:arsenate reductase